MIDVQTDLHGFVHGVLGFYGDEKGPDEGEAIIVASIGDSSSLTFSLCFCYDGKSVGIPRGHERLGWKPAREVR